MPRLPGWAWMVSAIGFALAAQEGRILLVRRARETNNWWKPRERGAARYWGDRGSHALRFPASWPRLLPRP